MFKSTQIENIHVNSLKFATDGESGLIGLIVLYNGKLYSGIGNLYTTQPDDHRSSVLEDIAIIDPVVRRTIQNREGEYFIGENIITVILFQKYTI